MHSSKQFQRNRSDLSEFVVHYTKTSVENQPEENLQSILGTGYLMAKNRFGFGKEYNEMPKAVCFTEAPLFEHQEFIRRRSQFGIGFRKDYVTSKGGGPILYAPRNSTHATAHAKLINNAVGDHENLIWKIAPFIDFTGPYRDSIYEFQWEREWRHVGDFIFQPEHVAFLLFPESMHIMVREFLVNAEMEQSGPNYTCEMIDPTWSRLRIERTLNTIRLHPPNNTTSHLQRHADWIFRTSGHKR